MFLRAISKLLIVSFLISFVSDLSGQVQVSQKDTDFLIYSQVKKTTQRVKDEEIYKGAVYLHDSWRPAVFKQSGYEDVVVDSVKLNIFRGEVEIHSGDQHLTVDNKQFDSFEWMISDATYPQLFKSKHYFFDNDKRLPGIIKQINLGEYSVIVSYISSVRNDSDKNPLMMDNLKKDKIVMHKYRYIEKGGALTRIKNKKDFKKFFKDYPDVQKYISKEKLNHKDEDDIARAVAQAFGVG